MRLLALALCLLFTSCQLPTERRLADARQARAERAEARASQIKTGPYSETDRELMLAGRVRAGFTLHQVLLSWGGRINYDVFVAEGIFGPDRYVHLEWRSGKRAHFKNGALFATDR